MVVFVLGRGEGFGETGARLRVGLLVDRAQVALHHAHRDAEFLGDLLERAFVLGYGYEHVDFARGESVVGDEGLTLLFDTRRSERFLGSLLVFALLLGLGQAEQARGYKRHTRRHKQHERADHDEGDIARGHKCQRDARRSERAHVVGGAAHASPQCGRVHARRQLRKRGSKERDKKARAQIKDDEAQVGIGSGFHGQDRDGGKYRDAEHDEAHVATLGKIKDDTGDETTRRQKEARPGLYGDGAVGVGERDDVIERREQAGENHDERDTPARLLGEGVRGLGKGIDGGTGVLGGLLGNDAEDGDGDSRCAKDDELCDTAAIEQVDGELHQDARGIGRPRTGGELGVILECQRKGVVSGGTQQAESKEGHAAQNLEGKRTRGGTGSGSGPR